MARTNRRSKHRGNAAGMIESRGRTGRKPNASEKGPGRSASGGSGGSSPRKNKYDSPPTWKGSLGRAVIAAVIVYALSVLLLNKHSNVARSLVIVPIVMLLYTPMIYYTDAFMYRRKLARNAKR